MDDSRRIPPRAPGWGLPAGPAPPTRLATTERDIDLLWIPTDAGDRPHVVRVVAERYSFSMGFDPRDFRRLGDGTQSEATAGVAEIARQMIGSQLNESLLAFFFGVRHSLVGYAELARGFLNSAYIEPRDVLRPALLVGATAIILAHNHPTGDVTPSLADCRMTQRLDGWLRAMGIVLADSVIVAPRQWTSLRTYQDPDGPGTTNLYTDMVE